MNMDTGYLILFGVGLGVIAFLLWMLFPISDRYNKEPKKDVRGKCPLCGHELLKGERIRSNQVEIGEVEVRTYIKGCPYCMATGSRLKRTCPVCKKNVESDQSIMAVSDPRADRKKLGIKGCKNCWPQGFDN